MEATQIHRGGAIPNTMPGSAIRMEMRDVSEYEAYLSPLKLEVEQVSGGEFHGIVDLIQTENLMLFRDKMNRAIGISGRVADDYLTFAAGLPTSPTGHVFGTPLRTNKAPSAKILAMDCGAEISATLPAEGHRWILLIRHELLAKASERNEIDITALVNGPTLDMLPAALTRFGRLVAATLDHCLAPPGALHEVTTRQSVESRLVNRLIEETMVRKPEISVDCEDRSKQAMAFMCAIDTIHASPRVQNIPMLARDAGVSQRTLQYAFKERLGLTPVQYVRVHRLNMARQELQARSADEATVTGVASNLEFDEFGRFAVDYRKLFGESPSDTLQASLPGFTAKPNYAEG